MEGLAGINTIESTHINFLIKLNSMKHSLRIALVAFFCSLYFLLSAQTGVLNPDDPVVTYSAANPPKTPAAGTLVKWVRTKRLSWNTDSYKCYYYNGMAFRLKFPKSYQHNVADGKTYPLFVFFHGKGEKGSIYDNEYQMYHGGELHKNAVDNGSFDGFLLYGQVQGDSWGTGNMANIYNIINKYLIPQVKVDRYRISVDGLSAGGSATWKFMITYPKMVAGCLPISASTTTFINTVNDYKYTPIWHFQGGLDNSPTPYTSKQLGNAILKAGGNYKYTEYPDRGHNCWYNAWGEADYFPFITRVNKVNPWALYGKTEFCGNDIIRDTLGVTAGFDGYEWRKDGATIPGATSNRLVVTATGTYDCRIKNGTEWSYYSPVPVVIKIKSATNTPDIKVSGLFSTVIPAPDGKTSVPLEEPDGYKSYVWQKEGSTTVLSTTRFYTATSAGFYKAQVTEANGCSSNFSALFNVVNANGPNAPDAPFNLTATATGRTSIQLDWLQNSSPAYNETNFEIYQSANSSAYKLIKITDADVSTYTVTGLSSGIVYSYIIRAINNTAASAVTGPATASTASDVNPPTAPGNLTYVVKSSDNFQLNWSASTDDVGVVAYDIYLNGAIAYTSTSTTYNVYNLSAGGSYSFYVKARDAAGNNSQPSNTVATLGGVSGGITYKYYEGSWNSLPDFNALTPLKTGSLNNISQSPRNASINYAFYYEGTIKIPVDGSYTFRTNSDDGSRLYINTPYSFNATPLVDNDGLHAPQTRDGTITLTAGTYSFIVTFFQLGGGANIDVFWNTPQTNNTFTTIPDSAFVGTTVTGSTPTMPYTININYNVDYPAASPWNNTSALPFEGLALTNMKNTLAKSSGVNMTLVRNFTGTNPNGMNTGNNSGVYPDNVMRQSYYVDHGDTALLRIDGLNQSMLYNFTFFGSRQGTGTRVTVYKIGNTAVSLNATNNTTNTVSINNIKPDANGAVFIAVYDPATSIFGYLNSLVINATNPAKTTKVIASNSTVNQLPLDEAEPMHDSVSAYPNPFVNDVVVKLWLQQNAQHLSVALMDASGRIVHRENFSNIQKGLWVQRLQLQGHKLPKGFYFITANTNNLAKPLVFKLVK